jgi:hypothetical protein
VDTATDLVWPKCLPDDDSAVLVYYGERCGDGTAVQWTGVYAAFATSLAPKPRCHVTYAHKKYRNTPLGEQVFGGCGVAPTEVE